MDRMRRAFEVARRMKPAKVVLTAPAPNVLTAPAPIVLRFPLPFRRMEFHAAATALPVSHVGLQAFWHLLQT